MINSLDVRLRRATFVDIHRTGRSMREWNSIDSIRQTHPRSNQHSYVISRGGRRIKRVVVIE